MKRSIRKQFAMIFISLLSGMLVLCWFINSVFLERYYIANKVEKIHSAYDQIYKAAGTNSVYRLQDLQSLTKSCFEDNIVMVVIDLNSRVVYSSPNGGEEFVISLMRFRMGRYPNVKPDTIERFSYDTSSIEYLGRFGTMENGNSYLICTPVESIRSSVVPANRFLAYVGGIMVVVGGVEDMVLPGPFPEHAAGVDAVVRFVVAAVRDGRAHVVVMHEVLRDQQVPAHPVHRHVAAPGVLQEEEVVFAVLIEGDHVPQPVAFGLVEQVRHGSASLSDARQSSWTMPASTSFCRLISMPVLAWYQVSPPWKYTA